MFIWFNKSITLEDIKHFGKETMASYLGMQWIEIGDDFLKLSMPVNEKTKQPCLPAGRLTAFYMEALPVH